MSELSSIFYDAVRNNPVDQKDLENLLQNFPYCQSFYIISASQQKGRPDFKAALQKAALYAPQRNILYKLINDPGSLIVENTEEVYLDPESDTKAVEPESTSNPKGEFTAADKIDPEKTVKPEFTEEDFEENKTAAVPEQAASETESSIFDNIASSDYFVFNNSTADPLLNAQQEDKADPEEAAAEHTALHITEDTTVSKYDDDKMPYTFLWWLQKTRKAHANTYQPYVKNPPVVFSEEVKKNLSDTLNQQIIENIFQSQIPVKEDKNASDKIALKHKEEELIEKFIQEEPQIKPPQPEKIDIENKARRSSEDHFDLVSETLAEIYIDQMLYHKAIDTYKKLSLKYPEKSAYFAAQIVELEKKIS